MSWCKRCDLGQARCLAFTLSGVARAHPHRYQAMGVRPRNRQAPRGATRTSTTRRRLRLHRTRLRRRANRDADRIPRTSHTSMTHSARSQPMARRPCIEDGCPTITDRTRCPKHERLRDAERGTRRARGYDAAHDREAQRLRELVRAGHTVTCWRCGRPITNPNDLHLGHDDNDRSITRGPEHGRACNLKAAGLARHGISLNG